MNSPKGTILITGANGGLGRAIVHQIMHQPDLTTYHGLYTVRDAAATTTSALTSALGGSPSHSYDILSLDLTKLNNIREVANAINERVQTGGIPPIRVLILNAGFQDFGKQAWTGDEGFDKTFSANYLGHWLLTLLLLKSMDRTSGRIIIVGSQSHDPYDKRNDAGKAFEKEEYKTFVHDQASFEAIAKGFWSSAAEDPSWRSGFRRYGAAKLFLIMFMHELQQRLNQDPRLSNIRVLGVDPGTMSTGLQRLAPWFIRVVMFRVMFPIIAMLMPNGPVRTTQMSAKDVLRATFEEPCPKDCYMYNMKPLETSAESRDRQKRAMVWKETVRYAQLKEGETVLTNWQ
ncbi:putative short-chain dehydrogenase [Hypoxylon sp. FL1284]|nr:putative short-chain dehydrogenase [Hypoxylon sp. FL1284]